MRPGLVLFLGNVRRGECETLLERDLAVGIIADEGTSKLADLSRFAVVRKADFKKDPGAVYATMAELGGTWANHGVLNLREHYLPHLVEGSRRFGYRAVSEEVMALCADKRAMHRRFATRIGAGTSAQFREIAGPQDLSDIARTATFPLVLKPSNLYGSLFVSRVETPGDLAAAHAGLVGGVQDYFRRSSISGKSVRVHAEELLVGSNHSIDCVVDATGRVHPTPVIDVLTGHDVGRGDFHHFARIAPSRLDAAQQEAMRVLAAQGVQALDMRDCVAHVEFIQTPAGPRLLEIAARPGGNRARILQMSHGVDLIFAYYRNQNGQPPDLRATRAHPFAIVTPFPRATGRLRELRDVGRIVALPTYHHHELNVAPGQAIGSAIHGFMNTVNIELTGPSPEAVARDVAAIAGWSDDLYDVV
jgi:biotin carboxylase